MRISRADVTRGAIGSGAMLVAGMIALVVGLVVGLRVVGGRGTGLSAAEPVPPTDGSQQSDGREVATPRGLAAALESRTGLEQPYAAYAGTVDLVNDAAEGSADESMRVLLEYPGGFLETTVSTDRATLLAFCDQPDLTCRHRVLTTGERAAIGHEEPSTTSECPVDLVAVVRADVTVQVRSCWWSEDPRAIIGIDDLLALAADPRIGLRVDPAWNRFGEQMTWFDDANSENFYRDGSAIE